MTEYLWHTKHAVVKKQQQGVCMMETGKPSLTSILIPQGHLFGCIWVALMNNLVWQTFLEQVVQTDYSQRSFPT